MEPTQIYQNVTDSLTVSRPIGRDGGRDVHRHAAGSPAPEARSRARECRAQLVRRRDGQLFDAIFPGLKPADDADRWLVTLELVRRPVERPAREAIATTIADWRAAERHLASLGDSDALRPVVEAEADLRDRYRELQPASQPETAV